MTGLQIPWRLAGAVMLGIPAALAGLLAALYGGLQTGVGRQMATPFLESQLAAVLETDASVEGLAELSLDRIRVAGLTLGAQPEPWLAIGDIDIAWRPFGLLAGKLSVSSLTVDSITLHRPPPDTGGEPLTAEDFRPSLAITVERFAVNSLGLGAPVLGEAATLRLEGEASAGDDGNGRLRLDVSRQDGPGGRLSARADYGLLTRKLDLGLSLDEPENGVLARLLDLPGRPAVAIKLDGAGTLDDWRGRIAGGAENLATLDSAVELGLDRELHLSLDGKADIAGLLPEDLRSLAAPGLNLAAKAAWNSGDARLTISDGRFSSAALEGTLTGIVDVSRLRADGKLSLRLLDGGALAALTAPAAIRNAEATVTLDGSFARPAGYVEARVTGVTVPGGGAETTELAADFELAEGLGGPVTVRGKGRLSGVAADDQNLRSLVGREVGVEAAVRVRSEGDIDLTAVTLRAAAGAVSLSGTVTSDGVADLAGSAEMPDLAVLNALVGQPIGGQASASVVLRLAADAVEGTVAADIHQLALPDAGPAAGLLGPEVTLAADIRSDAPGSLRIDNLSVDGRALSATGKADLLRDFGELRADYRLRLRDLSPLASAAGVAITGSAVVDGTAVGKLAAPRFNGRIEAAVRTPWDDATLRADATLDDFEKLTLRNIEATTLGTDLSGSLDIGLAQTLAKGNLRSVTRDLNAWAPVTGTPMAGGIEADITLSAPSGRQDVRLDLRGTNLSVPAPTGPAPGVRTLTATVILADALGARRIDGRAGLDDVALPEMRLDGIDIRARGPLERLEVAVSGQGPSLAVETAGILAVASEAIALDLAKLNGSALGQKFTMTGPARLRYATDDLAVSNLKLRVGEGRVATDLRLTRDAVELNGRIDQLPLSLLALIDSDFGIGGTLDGEIRLAGAPAAPNGRLALSTKGATVSVAGETVALKARTEGILDAGTLALTATVEGPEDARLTAESRLPVRLAVSPFELVVPMDEPVSAIVSGRGDLAALLAPFVGDPHEITGKLDLHMEVSGSAAQPRATGDFRVTAGRYENIATGTLLRAIDVEARFAGDRLNIVRATGLAGDGRIDVSGNVGLAPAEGAPLDIRLGAEKARVVQRDDLAATVSGDLALAGSLEQPNITGSLTVDDAEIRLVGDTPPQVTTLEVVEVNAPARQTAEPPSQAAPIEVALDLTITVPNRLFVRGQGLDSEWAGSLQITGSTTAPLVTGELTPVRGQFSFAGKTFVLRKGSTVSFRSPNSTTPVLNVTADFEGRDFTASFLIRGPADNPELTLTSTPELPQDEIVSRILFGRGVAQISALEAAQLAQAVARLSGAGGGTDFMDNIRRALGVDVLRVESDQGSGPAVTAGRYINKDVYVGVSQGSGAKSSQARVEVEVVPNVTLETEVGPTTGGEIGARWKFDY